MTNYNNKRIAKNTLVLYFRQILILLVSLYTVRIVLDALGVEDYGVYNVVAGVVSLLSFLSGSMSSATQRFFSFALGQDNEDKLKKVFSINIVVYGIIAIVAFILLETVGLWFVKNELNIPQERFQAAVCVYHFSIFTFVTTIFTAPLMAIIIAHEDMHIYAYISIVEVVLKLLIVFLLLCLPTDKLELYGILLFVVSFVNLLMYACICFRRYSECSFKLRHFDKLLLQEVFSFTGWTLFGQLTTVARGQAVTILLNQSFNPIVVAARAIATNVTSMINMFSSNFNVGLYPPIIKLYASDKKHEMYSLLFNGSKITFFLMWVIALPMLFELDAILNIWLKNPPPMTALFTRLAMVESLILAVSLPLTTAARAPGNMKVYELTLGLMQIAIFAIAWWALSLGAEAYAIYIVAIVMNVIMFFTRLIIIKSLIGLSVRIFFNQVVIPILSVISLSTLLSIPTIYLPEGIVYSLISVIFCVLSASISMYMLGLNKEMKNKARTIVLTQYRKYFKNVR